MTIHPLAEAFPNGSTSYDAIQLKLGSAFPLVLADAAQIVEMDFSQVGAVARPLEVRVGGVAFLYDSSDNTSAHNGVTVLKSADDRRYKSAAAPGTFVNVLSIVNAPPASPATGDRHIVGTAPTGAFASWANQLVRKTSAGWDHVAPEIGQIVYVRAAASAYHWGESGAWIAGAGAADIPAGSVDASKLAFAFGMVVESETATPPGGMPAAGLKWIVGTSATGVWAGHDTDIAEADGAGNFAFVVAYEGAQVFDLGANISKQFDGANWVSVSGKIIGAAHNSNAAKRAVSITGTSAFDIEYNATATTSYHGFNDNTCTMSYAARRAGSQIRVRYRAQFEGWTGAALGNVIGALISGVKWHGHRGGIALFRDSVTNALDVAAIPGCVATLDSGYPAPNITWTWVPDGLEVEFRIIAPDVSTHNYYVRFMSRVWFDWYSTNDYALYPGYIRNTFIDLMEYE